MRYGSSDWFANYTRRDGYKYLNPIIQINVEIGYDMTHRIVVAEME